MPFPGFRTTVFLLALAPLLVWIAQALYGTLAPDPGKVLLIRFAHGALVLLLAALAVSSLRRLTGWVGWLAIRRQLGLWSFFYGLLHLLAYLLFILGMDLSALPQELVERPYVLVGALAFLGLALLALTSNRYSIRRLGSRWRLLHRLVYPILLLVLLHYLWVVRADLGDWSLYAAAGALLLLERSPIRGLIHRARGSCNKSAK